MRFPLNKLLSAAAVVAMCALVPGRAEARFGKSGSSSSSSSSHSSNNSSSTSSSSHSHSSSPVGTHHQGGGGGGSYTSGGYTSGYGYSHSRPYRYGWGFGYRPLWWGYSAPPVYYTPSYGTYVQYRDPAPELESELPLTATVSAEAHGILQGGAGLGVNMALEKDRLGIESRFNGLFLPAEDGSGATDAIKLFDVHITYAILSGDHGRLRIGAGVDSAFAPSVVFIGPGLMANAAVGLAGPVGLDASITVVPFPFVKVDWQAGVAFGLGQFGVRAGWRRLYLNDNGYADGVVHEDVFSGPYVGLGLAL